VVDRIPCVNLSDRKTVDVWVVDLDDRSVGSEIVDSLLSEDELERAVRFVFEQDAWHFKLCRAILRVGLGLHLGVHIQGKHIRQIRIKTTERGKPYIEGCGLHFNVSHCRGTGLLAFTRSGEIGVDVEQVRTDVGALQIAAQHFHPREIDFIASAKDATEQACRFTRIWTRKEALLKATGLGISEDMKSFDVSDSSKIELRLRYSGGSIIQDTLILQNIAINESMIATLAGPDRAWTVMRSDPTLASLVSNALIGSTQ